MSYAEYFSVNVTSTTALMERSLSGQAADPNALVRLAVSSNHKRASISGNAERDGKMPGEEYTRFCH